MKYRKVLGVSESRIYAKLKKNFTRKYFIYCRKYSCLYQNMCAILNHFIFRTVKKIANNTYIL